MSTQRRTIHGLGLATALAAMVVVPDAAVGEWKPAAGPLSTQWAEDIDPARPLPEYPRPQLVRNQWLNLNGLWDYASQNKDAGAPQEYAGQILVPFPVESSLSGVGKRVGATKRLWYRRNFTIPAAWTSQRVWLRFGAVDWQCTAWVNGQQVGVHAGGYDPFGFDITDALAHRKGDRHVLTVAVWDPSDEGTQPRGKQRSQPRGIWYTPVTGIWQTVWVEPVPEFFIDQLRIVPDLDASAFELTVVPSIPAPDAEVRVVLRDGADEVATAAGPVGKPLRLQVDKPRPWTPDDPFLYDLEVTLAGPNRSVDRVQSYAGLRKIELGPDANGITRMLFNGQPVFQYGPLDQGWWPDGLYTAPTDAALRHDLEITKKLGFNMVRKHVKVEPARWYTHCDRLGLLVWQDMPNGDKHAKWPRDSSEIQRSENSAKQYAVELAATVDALESHPSIVVWVPFNEAWGQFETVRWARWLKKRDPSRLVIAASGGNDFPVGDVHDIHVYPGPEAPPAEADRAAVLGEFGGLGLPVAGHLWQQKKNWGYRTYETKGELQQAYGKLMEQLSPLVGSHLSAAVYTQTTDVEGEVNGLMTYDRRLKFDAKRLAEWHRALYASSRGEGLVAVPASLRHTVAWWRFEHGRPGQLVAHDRARQDGFAVRDASGHGNHLYAFGPAQAPRFAAAGTNSVPLTGDPNRLALDDSQAPDGVPTRDLYTDPQRSRTHMNALNGFAFRQWTVEASFRLARLDHPHGIVGKDGRPTEDALAPLQLKVRGDDNRVQIGALDGGGTARRLRSKEPVELGRWYHVAASSDGKRLRLYVDRSDGKGYQLQGETKFDGPLISGYGTWTLGRGFHNGRIADDALAWIDEVRISAVALTPNRFLFAQR